MACDTVVFDIGGTLIDQYTNEMYGRTLASVAAALGVDAAHFAELWLRDREKIHQRFRGLIPFDREIAEICALLGYTPNAEQVQEACGEYIRGTQRWMSPRGDAAATLVHLRSAGYRIGVLSNCSWELPQVWRESYLASLVDAAVFSCDECLCKPDPAIYLLVCERLGVEATQCMYVGDGSDLELTGAAQLGMTPVLICVPHEKEIVMRRDDPSKWSGPVIECLSEIIQLCGR